ncbi:Hypothetical predicted protein [Mytilus galloprovincialis]|uniref:Novel STAND NTPase 3 domain-containing protein n=1 Tax=Mytilus galloprovincialis TaxID=29158 RepID=A0A8B6FGA0_MYTGA|nr:Hypothetical predicted protein [Mytilus galloprovincialis]
MLGHMGKFNHLSLVKKIFLISCKPTKSDLPILEWQICPAGCGTFVPNCQGNGSQGWTDRDAQTDLKELWKGRFSHFVETRAFHLIKKRIEKEQCIIVSGPMGCGKSSTAFHIAMVFDKTEDCDVVIISDLDDLFKYASEDKKQLFLIDDVFGEYSVSDYKSMWWNHHGKFVQNILNKNKDLKLILTSRLHIFLTVKPTQPTFCHLDFTSEDLMLTLEERKMIGRCYLRDHIIDDIIDDTGEEAILLTSFFPSLCANVRAENKEHIIEYFTLPVDYISSEINNMRKSGDLFFLALNILIIFNNKVKKIFFNKGCRQYDEMLRFLSKEIGFNRQPSKPLLFSRFIALKRSYVLEESEYFECLHINLFNALVLSIGPSIVRTLILYGESSFLNKRTCLETSGGDCPKQTIVIPKELQEMYFDRMLSDMKLGKHELYKGHQHSSVEFRKSYIAYFKKYLKASDLKKGSHAAKCLLVMSAEGFVEYVEFFLGLEKTLVNLKDNCGQTALHKACLHGHTDVAKLLLDNGASIDLTDNNNETALYIACKNNKSETVEYLLSRGSNIKPKKCDSKCPLHVVCLNGNREIAKYLLDKNAKVNDQDNNKSTSLHLACANGHAKVVDLLIKYKIDVNLKNNDNKTAIYIAVEQGNIDIVHSLLALNPKLDIATHNGRVPLHCACELRYEDISELLIERMENINIADNADCTPLYIACKNGLTRIVKLLLHNNATVNLRNEQRNTPLLVACEKGYIKIVNLLLAKEFDPNCKNNDQMTPLYEACYNDQTDIVSLLIKYGALINEPAENLQTPLFRACLKGNCNVAKELLKNGASVNQPNMSGLTPLHEACIEKREDIVMLLLNSNADITKKDKKGVTPLDIACKSGNKCIEDALLLKKHDQQKLLEVSK